MPFLQTDQINCFNSLIRYHFYFTENGLHHLIRKLMQIYLS